MDRLLLIHESALKPLESKFKVNGIDMCAKNLLKHDADLLDKVAEKIRECSGLHYVDCDGYFGGIEELIFKVDDWLDDIIAELKAEMQKGTEE